MKIRYETSYLKENDVKILKDRFKNQTFTEDDKDKDEIEIVIAMPKFLQPGQLDLYPNLKIVQVLTAGYDQLDLDYFKNRNITLLNTKDVFSIQIAEDVFSKILYFNRNLKIHQEHMKEGLWKHEPVGYEICGSTVGILGTGSIGMEIAKRMKAFETKVLGYRQKEIETPYFDQIYRDQKGLEEIYQKSDYLIVALPLTDHTFHLVDRHAFSLMKKSAILINIARGEIIDQNAMIDALKHGDIRAAGLDVMTPEPLPKDHMLWQMDNVLITPHNASASPYVRQRLVDHVTDTLKRIINNKSYINRVI